MAPKVRNSVCEFMLVGLGKGGRKFYHCKEEDSNTLKLLPEPTNKYDKHAIKILIDDNFVGYVSKENNKQVKAFLNRKDSDGNNHLHQFYLIDKYSASARWLMIDLSLSLKRKQKEFNKNFLLVNK